MLTTRQKFAQALAHQQAGRLREAETCYRQILAAEPNHAEALHRLGLIALQVGRHDLAIRLIEQALLLRPDDAITHANLGELHRRAGRMEESIESSRRALALQPDLAEAWNNLGYALSEQGRHTEADTALRRALELWPDYPEAWTNLGATLVALHRLDEAIAAQRNAIRLKPDYVDAQVNLGIALAQQGHFADAVAVLQGAVELAPASAEAYSNLGIALQQWGKWDEAVAATRRAFDLQPDYGLIRFNYSLLLLLRGEYEKGWPLYEARTHSEGYGERLFPQPRWDGGMLEGKRVFLHAEQGMGDSIQFIRYAPLVAARGGKVIVDCQPALVKLFRGVKGVSEVVSTSDPQPQCDVRIPLLSLPGIFHTTAANIPREIPYLFADAKERKIWRERLGKPRARLRVGLAWAGNPNNLKMRRVRDIDQEKLRPLLDTADVEFVSLQIGSELTAPPAPLVDFSAELKDFADTAALVEELDLILSVDTAVAHLAGALGRPVWLLLPFSPDWRWGLGSGTTPWYPTMRLFRQTAARDWDPVIERVAGELKNWAQATQPG